MYVAAVFLFLASLAAGANVTSPKVNAKAKIITANYDDLQTDPDFIGGDGAAIPNPYKRLNYHSEVTVIALKEELLAGLVPPSGDNCIQVVDVQRNTRYPLFTKIDADASFTLRGFSFACAFDLLNEAEPLPCRLQITCLENSLSGNSADQSNSYAGDSDFQAVNTNFGNLGSCGFLIRQAGDSGNETSAITVFFDDFRYSTTPKAGT